MNDDFLGRAYVDNRHHLSDSIATAFGATLTAMRVGLDRLHARRFDVPWRRERRPR